MLDTITDLDGNQLDETFTVNGDEANGLYKLTGDWNRDGGVTIFDFPAFSYWFGRNTPLAPEYMDLNRDGGVSIFDFSAFASNFGGMVVFPVALHSRPQLSTAVREREESRWKFQHAAEEIHDRALMDWLIDKRNALSYFLYCV